MPKVNVLGIARAVLSTVAPKIDALLDNIQMPIKAKAELKESILKLQSEAELQAMANDLKAFELEVSDRADAREMQKVIRSPFVNVLAGFIVMSYFGCIGILIFRPPAIETQLLTVLLHPVAMALGTVMGFYFGGSALNDAKDKMREFFNGR